MGFKAHSLGAALIFIYELRDTTSPVWDNTGYIKMSAEKYK